MAEVSADLERFWSKVTKTAECWIWIGSTVTDTDRTLVYGQFWSNGKVHRAHRWIYGQLVEPVVTGTAVDHLCRNTLCVRPSHLEQVSQRANILRGVGPAAQNAAMTRCKYGHDFTPENTLIRSTGRRRCRTCYIAEQVALNARRRA